MELGDSHSLTGVVLYLKILYQISNSPTGVVGDAIVTKNWQFNIRWNLEIDTH